MSNAKVPLNKRHVSTVSAFTIGVKDIPSCPLASLEAPGVPVYVTHVPTDA